MKARSIALVSIALTILLLSGIAVVVLLQQKTDSAEPTPSAEPTSEPTPQTTDSQIVRTYTCAVVHTYPHDANAFTEGLVYTDGFLYESTGLYGESSLRRVDLETGTLLQEFSVPAQYFGEGIALVNDTILQLTWRENTGLVYDKESFAVLGNFTYATEGWGLTSDDTRLIMSDGSSNLYFLDPATRERTGEVGVHDIDGNSVDNLNELEYINGTIYANIFQQQRIAVINPQTGQVNAWIDLAGLIDPAGVANGIAYDAATGRLFVTGKKWHQLYEVNLVPSE